MDSRSVNNMNVLDIIVVIVILFGAFKGFKQGVIRSAISLVGTVVVFVLAYFLKNTISTLLYENLPFISFGGLFKGISSFNIIVYEAIAYFISLSLLFIVLKLVIKLTGIVDRLVKMTIILALPSKLLGALCKGLEYYLYVFVLLFILAQIPKTTGYFQDSNLGTNMVKNTPVLSTTTKDIYKSVTEIYTIVKDRDGKTADEVDYASLEVLLKYDVVSVHSVERLKEKKKLNFENIDVLIDEYKKGENHD